MLILSDTHGKTWRAGARVTDQSALPTNECDAVVLRNGSVLVSMRSEGTVYRVQARSDDGGETFVASSIHHVPDLPSPGCQSSLIADADGTLFLSSPYSTSTRENMSVSVSNDVSTHAIILGPIKRRNGLDQSSAGVLFERLLANTGRQFVACTRQRLAWPLWVRIAGSGACHLWRPF